MLGQPAPPAVQGLWPRVRSGESVGPYVGLHARKDGSRFGVETRLEVKQADDGGVAGARGPVLRAADVAHEPEAESAAPVE